jgi:hypothetical protein
MFTIQNINYKKSNANGYTRLCLYVRCDTTGERFKVNGNSDVGVDFYKAKTCIRFNREHIDSGDNLIKGLIEPTEVTSRCLAIAMKNNGHNTQSIKTIKDHFCWNTILSKSLPKKDQIDPDHWLNGLATVFPYMQAFDLDKRGQYCVNDAVVGLKKFLTKIGVYYSTHEIHKIVNHMGFKSPELFVENLRKLVDVPELSAKKILNLVNAIPPRMIPPETRRMIRIYVHIKEKQDLTGSIYVPLPPRTLWNGELDQFPTIFHESETRRYICLVKQRDDESRFVKYIQSREQADALAEVPPPRSALASKLKDGQVQAINNAFSYPVSLVAGPPGSGKTFITTEIVKQLHKMNVYFLAPTGKAVFRLKESVGKEVGKDSGCFFFTIHKFSFISESRHNHEHQDKHWDLVDHQAPNLFVIDEASMLGYDHMNLLFNIWKKVEPSVIVFLGDMHQLPPIGPGDLFRDLLSSNEIPCTILTERLRQQNDSAALMTAILAVENKHVPDQYDETFQYICLTKQIVEKAHEYLFPRYTYDDFRKGKVMVIAPKNETVDRLSVLIRATLVPQSQTQSTSTKTIEFYETDLVRCDENVYDSEFPIMRGTPGVVTRICEGTSPSGNSSFGSSSSSVVQQNESKKVVVAFGNMADGADDNSQPKLELNYAVTCHKAQGSEADHVVFVMEDSICPPLHKRNLLYTAMTRAKKTLTIIGPMDVLQYMVANDPVKRLTTMHEHIVE